MTKSQEVSTGTENADVSEASNTHKDLVSAAKVTLSDVRTIVSPYLPPPVLNLMSSIDSNPNVVSSLGDEPSMLILSAILAIFLVGKGLKFLSFLSSGKKVFEGLDDGESPEENVLDNLGTKNRNKEFKVEQKVDYDDSVILFGPSYAGKSLLFHTLLSITNENKGGNNKPYTVMSLKANVSYLKKQGDGNTEYVRIVDYPGHITLSSHLPSLLHHPLNSNQNVRALLVVDSTKVVSEAASLLYNAVLTNKSLLESWEKQDEILHIMVVCNKSDATNSKNWRRIKIQLRAELEKLKKISCGVSSSNGTELEGIGEDKRPLLGKSIDLDDLTKNGLTNIKISFSSSSCVNGDGIDAVSTFVTEGNAVIDNSSILTKRKQNKNI